MPAVLEKFKSIVGVGALRGPKRTRGLQDLYYWEVWTARDVHNVGALIGPWLSTEKRRQFAHSVGVSFQQAPQASLAWAAGFFDAEGSTSLSEHRSHQGYKIIEASVTQGGDGMPEELTRFYREVERGDLYGPYVQEGANEMIYRWRLRQPDEIRGLLHLIQPWLGDVKRQQAFHALAVVDGQPTLPRGRTDWGSHKTYCLHGHEYATARIRPYVGRGVGLQRRDSKQCLVCSRDQARARREAAKMKIRDLPTAERDDSGEATC